jgi:hypothetical protein
VVEQGLDDLEPGEHAEVAVVAPAGGDRVDVGAGHHRRATLAAGQHGHHVADPVDDHLESEVRHPRDDEVAAGPVGVGEGEPGAPARALDPAHLRQLVDASEQPGAVHPQLAVRAAGPGSNGRVSEHRCPRCRLPAARRPPGRG